jgi:hypothetical protein
MGTVREYSAVIEDKDMIRVRATGIADAVRQISSHCDVNELFRLGSSVYRVNGKLARRPATRVKQQKGMLNR